MTSQTFGEVRKELARELRDLDAFQGFVASLVQEESEHRVAEIVGSALTSLFGEPLGVVGLLQPETEGGGWEFHGHIEGKPLGAGVAERLGGVLNEVGQPLTQVPKMAVGPSTAALLHALNLQALHVLPVRTLRSPVSATLIVGSCAAGDLPPQKVILLRALAHHLGMLLENIGLRRVQRDYSLQLEETVRQRTAALERRAREQRALVEITRAVSAHLDRKTLFYAIADSIRPVISFNRLGIVMPQPDENVLVFLVLETREERKHLFPGVTVARGGSVPGWVLEHKRPFVASSREDLQPFPVSLEVAIREETQSLCALPLIARDRTIGVLIFFGKAQGLYDPAELSFLEEIAAAIAVALDKSLTYEELRQLKDRLNQENIYLQEEIKTTHNFEEIIGESQALKKVLKTVEAVAGTDSSVLLTGETGTGKELIVRAIHNLSHRRDRPLIKVNCAALPTGLIESELFGHEKGAFTGALSRKIGRFELAHKGTLFLDEIGDLPLELQAKLLRVLQEQEFERLGGMQTLKVDVRVIAATNRDLKKTVAENHFRADLYYRLSVVPISIPPLRTRKEDIPPLVDYFVSKHARAIEKRIETISRETMRRLTDYPWPGNVRELENVIERAVILSSGPSLEIGGELLAASSVKNEEPPNALTLEEVERNHILAVLEKTRWVIEGPKGAARILKLHPNTLRSRLKKLGIERPHHVIS